ncbi:MAG: hypothetical protein WC184_11495 [Acidimicrobiia bacterium]
MATNNSATLDRSHVLGTVYLPKGEGTNVGRFSFIVDRVAGTAVEIGTAVCADTVEGAVVGAVVDMRTVGVFGTPLEAELVATHQTNTLGQLQEVVVADVQVFHSEHMRPVRAGIVRAATATELGVATGLDHMEWPIPAGVVKLVSGEYAPIFLDGTYLLGPEGAHLTVAGLSGLAAKTSFMMSLLRSAVYTGGLYNHSVGALIFNVKGTDLLYLDEPPQQGYELQNLDRELYQALGVPAEPFDDVTVWSPGVLDEGHTRSERRDARPLRWDLRMVFRYLPTLFPYIYQDDKLSAFVSQFEDLHLNTPGPNRIDTLNHMLRWFEQQLAEAEQTGSDTAFGGRTHIATMRRLYRMFSSLPARTKGLIVTGSANEAYDDIAVEGWRHGQIVVVDISGLPADTQGFIMERTTKRIMQSAEEATLGVDHVIILADELNAFAPAQGGEMATVKKTLRTISTQGRYAGISMFGAAQKISVVDELVYSNAATRALGRTSDVELSSGVYGRLPSGLIERLVTLPKGQMALWAYNLRGAMIVTFPRPAWRTGKAKTVGGAKRAKTGAGVLQEHLKPQSFANLTEGIPKELVETTISAASNTTEAIRELEQIQVPDMGRKGLHATYQPDPENPYGLD